MKAIVKLLCLGVLVLVNISVVCGQRSPCPGTFDYVQDGSDIYGRIVIKPSAPTSQLVVEAKFTVTVQLFSNYYGTLQQENEKFALQNFNRGSPMNFRVHFPVTSPLPRLTSIVVNGQTICSGQGDSLRPNRYLTTFSLQHTSYFQGGGQLYGPVQPYQPPEIDDEYETNSQDITYDGSTPAYQPSTPAPTYQPSYRPPEQSYGNQNQYYPNYDDTTRRLATKRPQKKPVQAPVQPQYYPPEDTYYEIPKAVTTTERTIRRPVQPQPQPQPNRETDIQCGTRSSSLNRLPLIYGGEDYNRGDQPWLVALYKKSGSNLNFKCGGSLVSNRHVITAAHCMWIGTDRSKIEDMVVKLGVHRLSDWEDDVVVTRSLIDAKIHESFNSTSFKNDILVLTLSKEIKFNMYIRPACLWGSNTALELVVGASGVVVGWGEQNKHGGGADNPQLIRLPIVSTERCRSSSTSLVDLTSDKTLCAGDQNGAGPCKGDSGGGLYLLDGVKWRLRGIVSVSLRGLDGTCNLDEYLVFTDTAQYLPWIRQAMSKKFFD